MPELTFVFGPNNTFFFDSPKSWKFHNIPLTLRQLFNASMNPGWRVQQPYCVALAPQHKNQEPIWYIGCKVVDGSDKLFYTQTHFDMTYPDLSAWTKSIPAAPSTVFVVFGPGMTYFACAPGYGSIWSGIPIDLKDKVQKAFDTPCQVALGVKSAWFVMWPDGYYAWKFYGGYGELDKILDAAEPRSVEYLAISPYSPHQYFVAFRNRTVKYSLSPEWMPQMQQVFLEWQTEILRAAAQKPLPPHPSQYPYPSSPTPSYASTPQSQFAQLNNRTSIYQQAYGQTALSPQSPQSAGGGYFSTPTSPAPPYGYGMGTPVSPQSAGAYGAYPPYQSPQMLIVSPTGLPAQTSRDRKDSLKRIGSGVSDGVSAAHTAYTIASATGMAVGGQTCVVM